jgi:hypothetical protein
MGLESFCLERPITTAAPSSIPSSPTTTETPAHSTTSPPSYKKVPTTETTTPVPYTSAYDGNTTPQTVAPATSAHTAPVSTKAIETCTALSKRCFGAPGYPDVPWLGCCSGQCVSNAGMGWGKFCVNTAVTNATESSPAPSFNAPASNATTPTYEPSHNVPMPTNVPSYTTPKITMSSGSYVSPGKCYALNERCGGASGYPDVPWLGCCGSAQCATKPEMGWGKFCANNAAAYNAPAPTKTASYNTLNPTMPSGSHASS